MLRRDRSQRPPRIPSCEPCRLSKLSCDHLQPVCTRCSKRGIPDNCVYRKNPFKRGRAIPLPQRSQPSASLSSASSLSRAPLHLRLYPSPGFQGSSSPNIVLGDINLLSRTEDESTQREILAAASSATIQEGAHVLDLVVDFLADGSLRQLFDDWESHGLENHLGAFLIRPFFENLSHAISGLRDAGARRSGLLALSRDLCEMGNRPIKVDEDTTFQEFILQYTGQSLRWETLGVVLALAGTAATAIRAPHAVCKSEEQRHSFRGRLVFLSTACGSLCESFDALNDIQVIFLFETFLLHSVYYGDQSFKTWRQLNDAISALFASGIHDRIQQGLGMPFFLAQLRKRIFSRLYSSDMSFSVFLGRPPRISKRLCSIQMPLDVDESNIGLSATTMEQQLAKLDVNGWNTEGKIRENAVLRWAVTTATIREEIMEVLLGPKVTNKEQTLRKLRLKIDEAWEQLPSVLTVSPIDVWSAERPCNEVDTLHLIRLFYLQAIFFIEWTAAVHGIGQLDCLFLSASELLSWVNEALIRRERLSLMGLTSVAWRVGNPSSEPLKDKVNERQVAACGLPAAGALARCTLPQFSTATQRLLDPTAHVQAVESLSVLVAHLDHLHDQAEGNYQLCRHAKQVLQAVIRTLILGTDLDTVGSPATTMSALDRPLDWNVPMDQWGFGADFWMEMPGIQGEPGPLGMQE